MRYQHNTGRILNRTILAILVMAAGAACIIRPGICSQRSGSLDFDLPVPEESLQQAYLGVQGRDRFTLGQIAARVVIVEIFSMYCPICQREAADVNALFDRIRQDPQLSEQVKLLGIGAGNSAFEVSFFKKKYHIEFPLFADGDFQLHKQIGEVNTPHFFGLKKLENGDMELFFSRSGEIEDVETFLQTLLKESGVTLQP
ncbi:MAG TPA: TlpA disulfide reductase family protein [Desulfotignum sp.]|nr:TlpA disulfide reductase family protein [Desulfotignum sp.]